MMADFAKKFFWFIKIYAMLTLSTKNWRPSLYYRLSTNQKLQEIVFAKSATFGVKDILLPLLAYNLDGQEAIRSLQAKTRRNHHCK